jgi:hypothetical protein
VREYGAAPFGRWEELIVRKLAVLLSLVMTSALVEAATPSEGVPLKVRRGFFTETDIGGFFTVGGDNNYSNLQSYLQLGAGYQFGFGEGEKNAIPIGLHVGIGANAANCFAGFTDKTKTTCAQSDNFTVTFITATAGFMRSIVERFYIGGKALIGYTLLDPAPVVSGTGTSQLAINKGINFGVAFSVEYATNMDHFTIGFDAVYRLILGPNISTIQFFPRVKYTF